jgi:hypothetical protein
LSIGRRRSSGHFRDERRQSSSVKILRPLRRPLPRLLDGQPLLHLHGHVQRRISADDERRRKNANGRRFFDRIARAKSDQVRAPNLHSLLGLVLDDAAAETAFQGEVELRLSVSEVRTPLN